LEDWLFREDNYVVKEDKDKFINSSIFSVLRILSRIRRDGSEELNYGLYVLDPVVKLFFSIILIVLVSISRNIIYLAAVIAGALVGLLCLKAKHIRRVITLAAISMLFTTIMLLPSIITGNLRNSTMIIIKVIITILIINILSYSTKWDKIARALRLFFVPDIFILVLEITLKYIYILGEAALEMLYALKLRTVGGSRDKYSSISGIIGNLFLKSKEMGDEMYSAMECRGFTGEYTSKTDLKIGVPESIYIMAHAVLIIAFILLR
jgi:cobalt/nickel transport system permease protein